LAKRTVVVVKYARDNRYSDVMLCTHDLRKMDAISAVRLNDVWTQMMEHDVIGIDEGQFVSSIWNFLIIRLTFSLRTFARPPNAWPTTEKL
jgi:thymidine kinase